MSDKINELLKDRERLENMESILFSNPSEEWKFDKVEESFYKRLEHTPEVHFLGIYFVRARYTGKEPDVPQFAYAVFVRAFHFFEENDHIYSVFVDGASYYDRYKAQKQFECYKRKVIEKVRNQEW